MASASGRAWKSKEDYKKEKELEEARKAGTIAPELDEDGKEINPHIPQYIAQAPWYLNNNKPGLKHQRILGEQKEFAKPSDWYARGKFAGPAATKFRKGACTNCGAMSHVAKFCVDRPRKIGAKWTNSDIKPDEVVHEIALDFDGKRDRWNGYDARMHAKVIEEFDALDHARREQKTRQLENAFMTEPDPAHQRYPHSKDKQAKAGKEKKLVDDEESSSSDSEREVDDDLKESGNLVPIQKHDPRTRTTIRNLRIREDTAKYLRNLDINSAYYDPKTRSMRENPVPAEDGQVVYQGDNFVRHSGDFQRFAGLQCFTFDAYEHGTEVHMQGAPSQAELSFRQFKTRKEDLKHKQQDHIKDRYGEQDSHEPPPKELLLSQTEAYVEYALDGRIIKGAEKAIPKSKYEEDAYVNNHTTVWGSYWVKGQWGFACCHQLLRNSYCTGEAGKEAMDAAAQTMADAMAKRDPVAEAKKLVEKKEQEDKAKAAEKEKRKLDDLKKFDNPDDRSRPYNSFREVEVTEDDIEEYRSKKIRFDDPMRAFFESKESGS